jgi:hypothetical protein
MPDSELMPNGDFARRSGLTSSALRFYADSGLLRPAEVDPASGYRYYGKHAHDRHSHPTMEAIGRAVTAGRVGEVDSARRALLDLWSAIGVTGDPLHRCSLAHYLADLHTDPARAPAWDVRALDAADAVTQQHVQEHGATLRIAGAYPSLHLDLADGYRRLASLALGEYPNGN